MKEEQGKKLDPNDPAIPAKPTDLSDEDLDKVAGGGIALAGTTDAPQKHSYIGTVTLVK